ncbi:MAG: hypothetical protein HGB20_09400 [Chlorobiaceae bacterium]|nr:hypothetical protein [Chlorobiaceae bacterium]
MNSQLIDRVDYLILLCYEVLKSRRDTQYNHDCVDGRILNKYRAASLSFLSHLYGEQHPYFLSFFKKDSDYGPTVESTLGILEAIKDEISKGWHRSTRGVVSAEVFSDFVEMAQHLLAEGYKDAAAVMLGSTLEEHLRQLCRDSGIKTTVEKEGKTKTLKADALNIELAKSGFYSALDQKSVTAWLAIRNSAAHGKYDEYTKDQVQLLAGSLADFMVRTRGEL